MDIGGTKISFLIALVGDLNSHGAGALQTPPQTKFRIGGKLVTTVDTVAAPDSQDHPTGPVNSATGSAKWTVSGYALHRHNDTRYCGATTVVSMQTKFKVGGSAGGSSGGFSAAGFGEGF